MGNKGRRVSSIFMHVGGYQMAKRRLTLVPVNARGYRIGEQHHRAKLSDHDIELIHELLDGGMTQRLVAQKFEVSRSSIRDIRNGRNRSQTSDAYRQTTKRAARERDRQNASRWPCRIKPAKPEEFD